jgi:septum site-determining protein MinC
MGLSEQEINVKGTGDGLIISFKSKKWNEIHPALIRKIDENTSFFTSARVALDVGECAVKAVEMGKLCDELSEKNISIWAILSTCDSTLKNAQSFGIPTQLGLKKTNALKEESLTVDGESALWIERTLRAGYRIETKCHVIVMGDVNPGAEIISAGNIFIWGRMNGSAHAGAEGNQDAKIYALQMKPTQLRIANLTATPFTGKIKGQAELACIEDNKITIKVWTSQKQI